MSPANMFRLCFLAGMVSGAGISVALVDAYKKKTVEDAARAHLLTPQTVHEDCDVVVIVRSQGVPPSRDDLWRVPLNHPAIARFVFYPDTLTRELELHVGDCLAESKR